MGTIRLFVATQGLSEETVLKLRHNELALNCIEDAVGHLIVLSPHIGIPAADWNVQSTGAQFALGRVLTALERAKPWQQPAERGEARCSWEGEEALTKAKKGVGIVAALAAALCSRDMTPGARWRAESAIASEVRQLIAELGRVRALLMPGSTRQASITASRRPEGPRGPTSSGPCCLSATRSERLRRPG
jgi:hypothetical protein